MERFEPDKRNPRNFPPNPAEANARMPPIPENEVKEELRSSIKSSNRVFEEIPSQAKSQDAIRSSTFPFGMKPHPRVLDSYRIRRTSDAFHSTNKESEAVK
jgi:hypothetical protein